MITFEIICRTAVVTKLFMPAKEIYIGLCLGGKISLGEIIKFTPAINILNASQTHSTRMERTVEGPLISEERKEDTEQIMRE